MSKGKITCLVIFLLLAAGFFTVWFLYRSGKLEQAVINKVGEKINEKLSASSPNALQEILGYAEPRTYLLLFLNNTEMRPGGGFIGVYAVVKMDKGEPNILKVEGTEILDNSSPNDFAAEPPAPLKKYLGIKRWEFRDSNWSPDFASSSAKALELYKLEHGVAADDIDAVIGFTPTVIEEILKINGPITVDGIEFNASNFTEKLEYEVEYGYAKRGISFDDRKKILINLTHTLIGSLKTKVFLGWPKYLALGEKMLREKQVVAYSVHPQAQKELLAKNISGEMKQSGGDYLLWVDANLAALKTDASITRELSYTIAPVNAETKKLMAKDNHAKFVATAKMIFKHSGKFDWRTSRYLDYVRVYVPRGSKLLRKDKSIRPGPFDQGIENGRQWFGAFISVEPGKTGSMEWEYTISADVEAQVAARAYYLLVQKQIGTIAPKLTLSLDFGKSVVFAAPGEPSAKHGDTRYDLITDLREDREFSVKLK